MLASGVELDHTDGDDARHRSNWLLFKTTMAELKTQINKNAQDVDELKKELDDLRSDLPFIYTTREDFIRTMNNVDKKLDKIHDSMLGGQR
ncbi:hypothetical protein [Paenibacillus melissococcoides]|nr:hypothetical protein [Paenibacillus melissococcoides]